jgi:uncharacterized protein (TIGR02145 family)
MQKYKLTWCNPVLVIGVTLLLTTGCSKDEAGIVTGTVSDIDGNVYITVTIGAQVWMAENLNVTHYRNGEIIPNISDGEEWNNYTSGACCDYENLPYNSTIFGKLYNFHAINDPRGVCPTGWHIPTDNEWTTLINYLGGNNVAGAKLKETGTDHWHIPNKGSTNQYGFSALPGGNRIFSDPFLDLGEWGWWWSSTESDTNQALVRAMFCNSEKAFRSDSPKNMGFSVRCIKD